MAQRGSFLSATAAAAALRCVELETGPICGRVFLQNAGGQGSTLPYGVVAESGLRPNFMRCASGPDKITIAPKIRTVVADAAMVLA